MVGADVEGLYPSPPDVEVAITVCKAVLESGMKFENIDFRKAGKYVAMHPVYFSPEGWRAYMLETNCAAARIVIYAWDSGWLEVMEQNVLRIKTGVRYMDDIRIFANAIK